jgi:hypothetical protein
MNQKLDEMNHENMSGDRQKNIGDVVDSPEPETCAEDSGYAELEKRFSENPGVENYTIFDNSGKTLCSTDSSVFFSGMPVPQYFSIADSLADLTDSPLKFLSVGVSTMSNFVLTRAGKYFVAAQFRPGTGIDKITNCQADIFK